MIQSEGEKGPSWMWQVEEHVKAETKAMVGGEMSESKAQLSGIL